MLLKGYMSILYVGCMEFSTNRFIKNLCLYKGSLIPSSLESRSWENDVA
jgi:hypothetical protein